MSVNLNPFHLLHDLKQDVSSALPAIGTVIGDALAPETLGLGGMAGGAIGGELASLHNGEMPGAS
jgi:hypothetical protein